MNERLISPPMGLAVSLDAARRAARVSGSGLDAELTDKVRDYTDQAEHATGRALITQTWELTGDAFPDAIKLPHPPIVNVTLVQFYDVAGVLQTLDPQDYTVDTMSEPGWLLPAPGKTWPATAACVNAVVVQYVCGYGGDYSSVPAGIQGYIVGMVENDYFPNPNAQYLARKLDRACVFG